MDHLAAYKRAISMITRKIGKQWRAMYSHLLTIFASGVTPVPLQTSIWNHASAESRIKARLDFSERRLHWQQ